jgi:predicted nucleotidyltransferase component of viral defense system
MPWLDALVSEIPGIVFVDVERSIATEFDGAIERNMAGKVRALIGRARPGDLYDAWLLLAQGVTLERGLVGQKLAPYGLNLAAASLEPALSQAARDWERDQRPLLPQYVDADRRCVA